MPTKYSPIAPIHLLHELEVQDLLGDYLLLLAHDVLAHPKEYDGLIMQLRGTHLDDLFIIMDNGVIENGAPVSVEELLEAASIVEADVVVGPDMVGDLVGTKKLMMSQGTLIRSEYPMMFIPQGGTFAEIFECIDWYSDKFPEIALSDGPSYWGVPRWIANELGSRHTIVRDIVDHDERAKIHLLGMSNHYPDDLTTAMHPNVVGIDSANPLVLAYKQIELSAGGVHMPRGDYWTNCKQVTELMRLNIQWMRHDLNPAG